MTDHSILSPSGHVSKRTRKRTLERVRRELFGDGLAYPTCPQPTEAEYHRRLAVEFRALAARGVSVRKHERRAMWHDQLAMNAEGKP